MEFNKDEALALRWVGHGKFQNRCEVGGGQCCGEMGRGGEVIEVCS